MRSCKTCKHNLYQGTASHGFVDCGHPIAIAKQVKWEEGDPIAVEWRTAAIRVSELPQLGECPTWEARDA